MEGVEKEALILLPALKRYARYLTRSRADADDLVQEALFCILRGKDSFRGEGSFETWAFTIMRHCFFQTLRRARRSPEVSFEGIVEEPLGGPSQESLGRLREIERAVLQLPARWRSVLMLAAEGFDYETIATVLQVKVGTVRSRLSRARSLLKGLLDS